MKRLLHLILTLALCVLTGTHVLGSYVYSSADRGVDQIKWVKKSIRVAVSTSLSDKAPNIKTGNDISGALKRSFSVWEEALGVRFVLVSSEAVNVSPSGNSGDGISLITAEPSAENLQIFGGEAATMPAATRIFFDRRGRITEADIVLNPIFQFSTDGTFGTFDLESVLVHEIGHLLGLDHPPVSAGVMSTEIARNGLYGVPQFSGRELSLADISLLRSVYGSPLGDATCCSQINGRILSEGRPSVQEGVVWAEDAETGRVVGSSYTDIKGAYSIKGLSSGLYSIYWRTGGPNGQITDEFIDTIDLLSDESITIDFEPDDIQAANTLKYVGLSGQLSNVSVPVVSGKAATIYLSYMFEKQDFSIGSSSPYITVEPGIRPVQEASDGNGVISFEISVHSETPPGYYSLFLRTKDGARSYLPGGLIVSSDKEAFLTRN